jgi:Flp pilus assembly protein TadD
LLLLIGLLPALQAAPATAAELSPDSLTGGPTLGQQEQPLVEDEHTISLARLRLAPPPDAKQKLVSAWQAFENHEPERAIDRLKKAIQIHPEYVEAHNNLGFVLWHEKRLSEAITEFETAVALDPSWPTALVNLALAYYAKGDLDKAHAIAEQAVKVDPDSARAHYAAGVILLESNGQNGEALEHLREASGDYPKAQLMEAYLMLRLNRPEKAQQTLHTYLMRTPMR